MVASTCAAALALVALGACASSPHLEVVEPVETVSEVEDPPDMIYIVLLWPSTNFPADVSPSGHPAFNEHAAYMEMLHEEGFVSRGGPFADFSGALLEFRIDDREDIDGLMQEEPFVLADVWTYTIHAWVQALSGEGGS